MPGFATTPSPPYYVAMFTSQRHPDDDGYGEAAARMAELAAQQPGFLGTESVRNAEGFGITLSYWESEDAIAGWRRHIEHTQVRDHGRSRWYAHYEVRIARVERAYAGPPKASP